MNLDILKWMSKSLLGSGFCVPTLHVPRIQWWYKWQPFPLKRKFRLKVLYLRINACFYNLFTFRVLAFSRRRRSEQGRPDSLATSTWVWTKGFLVAPSNHLFSYKNFPPCSLYTSAAAQIAKWDKGQVISEVCLNFFIFSITKTTQQNIEGGMAAPSKSAVVVHLCS